MLQALELSSPVTVLFVSFQTPSCKKTLKTTLYFAEYALRTFDSNCLDC